MSPLANLDRFAAPETTAGGWSYAGATARAALPTPPLTGGTPAPLLIALQPGDLPAAPELESAWPPTLAAEALSVAPDRAESSIDELPGVLVAIVGPFEGIGPLAGPEPLATGDALQAVIRLAEATPLPSDDLSDFDQAIAARLALAEPPPLPERSYGAPLGVSPAGPLIEVVVAPPVLGATGASVAIPRPAAVLVGVRAPSSSSGGGGGSSGGGSNSGGWSYAIASWYGPGFYGNRTACGQTYSSTIMGVAHRTLPCGTAITFMNGSRVVTARVIDRGPYVGGRTFDLSAALCRALGHCYTGGIYWRFP
jgi:hypothetical protein